MKSCGISDTPSAELNEYSSVSEEMADVKCNYFPLAPHQTLLMFYKLGLTREGRLKKAGRNYANNKQFYFITTAYLKTQSIPSWKMQELLDYKADLN